MAVSEHDVREQHHGMTRLAASRGLHARALEQPGVAQLVLLPTSISSGGRRSECGLRNSFKQEIYQQIVYTSRFVRASFAQGQCLSFSHRSVFNECSSKRMREVLFVAILVPCTFEIFMCRGSQLRRSCTKGFILCLSWLYSVSIYHNSDVVRCGRYRNIQTCSDSLRI